MSYFSKSSGVVVSISEFDRTEELTELCYPIYNYNGGYIGYVDRGLVYLVNGARVDPMEEAEA